MEIPNRISKGRSTMGVVAYADFCYLGCREPGTVRVNIDGIWTVLCEDHRRALISMLENPLQGDGL
jgi:hypothetical protein